MSSTQGYAQRKSWRSPDSTSGGNRWIGRFLITAIALALIAWFIYLLLRPRPKPTLQTHLVHAGSFHLDAIMPPMYGRSASERIKRELDARETSGESEKIDTFIRRDVGLGEELKDPDDTVMVIVRGYVLAGPDGRAAIACSDLGGGNDPSSITGLVGLDTLFQRLTSPEETPESFSGTRLVVLDIEPLAALPRLNQYGDEVFDAIINSAKGLSTRHADRLWVLITRGPLQNVGWDPQSKMPVTTQTLLDALGGRADLDEDGEVGLDEVCRYSASRYARLARGTGLPSPQLMLLRGGTGLIDEVDEAQGVWVAKAKEMEQPAELDEQPLPAPEELETNPQSTSGRFEELRISPVRFQSAETPINDVPTTTASTDPPESANTASIGAPAAMDTASVKAPPPLESFWDIRDRLESDALSGDSSDTGPPPIAVAPHLWRKWVQNVLHSEIETIDDAAGGLRSESLQRATDDAKLMLDAVKSSNIQDGDEEASDEVVTRILTLWRRAAVDRSAGGVDDQVRAADQLQWLIAIGRTRLWNIELYERQAIISGAEPISTDPQFEQSLIDAETLLGRQSGTRVDQPAMRRAAERVRMAIDELDSVVNKKLKDLISDFDRTEDGAGWNVVRQAMAWVRSPLPRGQQRRELLDAIAATSISQPDREMIAAGISSIELASRSPDRGLLAQIAGIRSRVNSTLEERGGWSALTVDLIDDSNFGKQFIAAVGIDPSDAEIDLATAPIMHAVEAIPRERQLSVVMLDSSRQPLHDRIELESLSDHLSVQISPDSKNATKFRITAKAGAAGSQFDDRILETKWQSGIDVQATSDDHTIELSIPAGRVGEARLDIQVFKHGDQSLSEVPITFEVRSLAMADDPKLDQLNGSKVMSLRLPQSDRVRVVVKTEGLSGEKISGDDNLPGGVWLRTFASRTTDFTFSLFNETGRPCSARLWLVKLEHPFVDENVIAYWPEVLVGQMRTVRGNLIGSDGRVFDTLLFGNQKLKGPIDVRLGGDKQRTPLAWEKPADPQTTQSQTTSAPETTGELAGSDVSHGFALVARLIDESGNAAPGPDQVIWLVPKPWYPEEFIDLDTLKYERGKVQVSAKLKPDFDGDGKNDMIPSIEKTPVVLAWTENAQWESFQPSSVRPLDRQTQELKFGLPSRGRIEVPVSSNREKEAIVQLDVDGWPRAILRSIAHREGATAGRRERYDEVQFSSVSIDYGDDPPSHSDDDDKLEPTKTVFYPDPDVPVIFRGRAKSLITRIAADVTTTFFAGSTPPEIKLSDGSRFWTDRIVHTVADAINDKGKISLTTQVDDLEVSWNSAASRPDDHLDLKASLKTRDQVKNAAIQITLDSTPPKIDGLRRGNGRIYLGDRITWKIVGSDPDRNEASSGLDRIIVGLDKDGDNKPDSKDNAKPFDGNMIRTFNAPDSAGSYRLAVQAWDMAGIASDPKIDTFQVYERPKPKPNPPEMKSASPPTPGVTAAPPAKPVPEKRGTLAGKIDIGSTMRGKLTLSPVPKKISPASGVLEIGDSRPSFSFSNVPEGEYTITFQGTVGGSIKSFTWSGLTIDKTHSLPAN